MSEAAGEAAVALHAGQNHIDLSPDQHKLSLEEALSVHKQLFTDCRTAIFQWPPSHTPCVPHQQSLPHQQCPPPSPQQHTCVAGRWSAAATLTITVAHWCNGLVSTVAKGGVDRTAATQHAPARNAQHSAPMQAPQPSRSQTGRPCSPSPSATVPRSRSPAANPAGSAAGGAQKRRRRRHRQHQQQQTQMRTQISVMTMMGSGGCPHAWLRSCGG
jgi:hypothetical protein